MSRVVSSRLVLHWVDADTFVDATFLYDAAHPYAVTLLFPGHTPDDLVEWTFARDLLAEGMWTPSGVGDVRVSPHDLEWVVLELIVPDARCRFLVPRMPLVTFLARTSRRVPAGSESEHVDMDTELAELLARGARS